MPKQLVLAEKPSVAREIARVLGSRQSHDGYIEGPQYIVTWALGHLVTLAEPEAYGSQYKEWRLESLPMLPDRMELVVIGKTAKQFGAVRALMARGDVSELIIATDAGREGELVARWIMQKAGFRKAARRLWISSQTDRAILDGFRALKPASQYDSLFRSAACRAEADWLVGLNVTRALACKHNAQLSAGRVQTPTLSMIVRREEEIRQFAPQDYYRIAVEAPGFFLTWRDRKTGGARIGGKAEAEAIAARMAGKPIAVTAVRKQRRIEPPPLAYDLTELQRDANRLFAFSAKKTLSVLQALYETHKLVTYPRTDSRHITRDVAATLQERLKNVCKGSYARAASGLLRGGARATNRLVDDAKVTDHHAILPTEQFFDMGKLDNDEKRVFDLVVKRFLAILSPPFEYEETEVTADIGGERAAAKGRVVLAQGWREIYAGPAGSVGIAGGAAGGGAAGAGSGGAGSGGAAGANGRTGRAGGGAASGGAGAAGGRGAGAGAGYGGRGGAGAGGSAGAGAAARALYADDDEDESGGDGADGSESRGAAGGGQALPPIKSGDRLASRSVSVVAGKTKPPARYTEATLLTAMEHPGKLIGDRELSQIIESASGIGTPATRADIIEKLFDAFYVERGGRSGKEILPTRKGIQLAGLVPGDLRSAELTARWERQLEQIAKGRAGSADFMRDIRAYAAKLVSAVIASPGTYRHENMTRERCPECGKFLLAVNGKKGEMLVCADRECGYRKSVAIVSNARCPNCHKKLSIRGEGEQKSFFCACGYRERLSDFEARRASQVGKVEVERYMAAQSSAARSSSGLNSALADQLKSMKI
ncbi:MAG: DNA topoisomerase III [Clostridiales bacterium]|jgi:DNA topoisomerase-3|nr:DNA topoisomerase III [Clostridiales bacterium]